MRELEVLESAFRRAAPVILGGDRAEKSKENAVGMYDIVTGSDVAAEDLVVGAIREAFPDDTIISEETNPHGQVSDRTWALDPIDGTMNFSRGIPLFGMQAVFMDQGIPKASAIYLPMQDEMFTATSEGAFLNGRRIRTADPRPLKQCIMSTGDFSKRSQTFRDAQAAVFHDCYNDIARFKVFGASCVDYSYLACGRTDIHLRFANNIWDFLPGMFLAEKAGAVYDRELMASERILMMCSSQEVLDEALGTMVPRFISCFRR